MTEVDNHHPGVATRMKFSWSEFGIWVARYLSRLVRHNHMRYYLRSPSYGRIQVLVDTQKNELLKFSVRDEIDIAVIQQVFVAEDYSLARLRRHREIVAWVDSIRTNGKRPLILDLGANTGLASLYFTREFPDAAIVALEPDPGNAAQARKNLRGFNSVKMVEGGISNQDGRANIVNPDDGNWAYRTEKSETGSIEMVSVAKLIERYADARSVPFIAKIDIEGFEDDLFARNTEWFDAFPIVIIELHDWLLPGKLTSQNFLKLVSQRDRDFVYAGENVFSIANSFASVDGC